MIDDRQVIQLQSSMLKLILHYQGNMRLLFDTKNPDGIDFYFTSDNSADPNADLLDKDHRVVDGAYGETIRKGTRIVNGLHAAEWFVREKQTFEGIPVISYSFTLQTHEYRDREAPLLEVNMKYTTRGGVGDKVLSESHLISMWELVTGTLTYDPS